MSKRASVRPRALMHGAVRPFTTKPATRSGANNGPGRPGAATAPVRPARALTSVAVGLTAAGLALGLGVAPAGAVPGGKMPTRLEVAVPQTQAGGTTCAPSSSPAAQGLTSRARHVLDCVSTRFPSIRTYLGIGNRAANGASDHPSGRAVDVMIPNWNTQAGKAQGWEVANYVAANARSWNVNYIIWDARIYNARSGTWRAYRHPSGAKDANSLHLNHVHVSVNR